MRQLRSMRLADSSSALLAPAPLPAAAGLHLRVGKLCVALQAQTPAELLNRAEAILADCRFLEFRLDSLPKPAAVIPRLNEFLSAHRDVTAIATCRRKENGGHFTGSLTAELEILLKAAECGCHIVDL